MNPARHETASGRGAAGAFVAEEWLGLAAAPTFALMALLNAVAAADPAAVICSSAGLSPIHGMFVMYALMSAFHLGPWVRMIRASRPRGGD